MKRGYKRLLVFFTIILIILILNSFVSSILDNYNMVVFLLTLLVAFKFLFGFEKDRHRYIKDVIFEMAIFLLIFFLLYYLSGLIVTFARTENYYSFDGIVNFVIPLILIIILKEYLRYAMLVKSEGNNLLIVYTCIVFIFLDVTSAIYYGNFKSNYDIFIFIALSLLPAISTNIMCCYVSIHTGYKPVIFYLLVIKLYQYLLPIVPNPNEYVVAIINFLLPVLFIRKIYLFYAKDADREVERDYRVHKILPLIVPASIVAFLVYITSGYFHYYAIVVASGSMSPQIKKGDVVIIEKIDKQYSKLKKGQVVAYKYDNVIIVHRLIKTLKVDNKYYFYTKGDANKNVDGYAIEENMIIGTVNIKVPYVGLPTVWLNEL